MNFTRNRVKAINADIKSALNKIGKKYQCTITLGSTTFTSADFKTRILGYATTNDGQPLSRDDLIRQEVTRNLEQGSGIALGLTIDHQGTVFTYGGQAYKFLGIKPSYRKYPIVVERTYDKVLLKLPVSASSNIINASMTKRKKVATK